MKFLKNSLLILMVPLFAFSLAHKFYVSVTNVGYSEKDAALQITSRIFIDDLEAVLKERYGIDTHLATENEAKFADEYIEKYFRAKFVVKFDETLLAYDFLGKKYDNDVVICYIEVPEVDLSSVHLIALQNEILTDLFDEQQNIVHFKINDTKKSFVLIKERSEGMLKL